MDKPPYGSPCNNCGQCCADSLCVIGEHLFGRGRVPCPALETNDGLSSCGLITRPQRYCATRARLYGVDAMKTAALVLTATGIGCDALLIGEDRDPAEYLRMAHAAMSFPKECVAKAVKVFGMEPISL